MSKELRPNDENYAEDDEPDDWLVTQALVQAI